MLSESTLLLPMNGGRLDSEEPEDGHDQRDVQQHGRRRPDVGGNRLIERILETLHQETDAEADQTATHEPQHQGSDGLEGELGQQRDGGRGEARIHVHSSGRDLPAIAQFTVKVVVPRETRSPTATVVVTS
jgi:hypothetical protein